MGLITWSESYSVKVKQFDDQHKKLIDMVNELHDAMMVGKGKDILGKILDGLIKYTGTHFADEERLMKQHGFPEFEIHKKEHNKLVMQVLDIQKQFQNGNAVITQAVMAFLKDWLQKHIKGDDAKYGVYFNAKGIA